MRKVKRKVNNPKQNVQSYNKDKIKTVSSNHQIKDTNIQSKLTKEQYKKLLDQKKLKQQSNIEKHSSKEKETLNREQYQKLLTKEHSNTKDSQQNKVKKKLTKEQYQKLLEQKKALERKKALTNSKNNSLNISSKTSTKSNNKITREQYQKLVEKRMKNAESASTGKSNHLTREEYQKRIEQKKLHDTQMNLSILKTLSNDEKTLKKNHSSQIIAHEKRKATDNNKLDTTVQDIYNKKSSPTLESKKGRKKIDTRKKKKKKTKLKPWAFWSLIIIFSLIIIIPSLKLFKWHGDNKKIADITDEIESIVEPVEIDEQGELINPPSDDQSDYWYYVKMPFYEVDFDELKKKNSDTVAFIHMNSTNINYPIVQTTDNKYYLAHAFDKSKNDAGWVFMDYRNDINNLSDNTVVYGHGRVDKTVFGSLRNVLTSSWQNNKDNYVLQLSTPLQNMVFQIFSVYTIKSESYYITTTFANAAEKEQWLNTMKSRNIAPTDTSVNVNDKIITLSTCKNNSGDRIVAHAKLIKIQNKVTPTEEKTQEKPKEDENVTNQ